jgi:anti-sigma factor RsiW
MNCRDARTRLSAYIDRQLPPEEQTAVGLHATVCDPCRTHLHSFLQIKKALRAQSLPPIPAPVLAAIEAATIDQPPARRWISWTWWLPAAVLATAAGAWLLLRLQTPQRMPPLRHDLIAWQRAADSTGSVRTQ